MVCKGPYHLKTLITKSQRGELPMPPEHFTATETSGVCFRSILARIGELNYAEVESPHRAANKMIFLQQGGRVRHSVRAALVRPSGVHRVTRPTCGSS